MVAAVENIFPPVPADVAVSLGAFLSGRGVMNAWLVFLLTWIANVGSGAAVYALARRHGRAVFQGVLGRRLFSDATIARIEEQYERHGAWGWRALVPLAAATAVYYGALTFLIATLGTNLDDVLRVLGRVNAVLGVLAAVLLAGAAIWIVRRLKR